MKNKILRNFKIQTNYPVQAKSSDCQKMQFLHKLNICDNRRKKKFEDRDYHWS